MHAMYNILYYSNYIFVAMEEIMYLTYGYRESMRSTFTCRVYGECTYNIFYNIHAVGYVIRENTCFKVDNRGFPNANFTYLPADLIMK